MSDAPAPDSPEPTTPEPPAPRRFARARRGVRRALLVAAAVAAAGIVATLAIDIGPFVQASLERRVTVLIDRPIHARHLSVRLLRGVVVADDVVIDTVAQGDGPFLTAKTVTARIPWWSLIGRRLDIESVTVDDWRLVIESFKDGRHNFIRIPTGSSRPSRFTTTTKLVRARRGEVVYRDHGTPWSIVARDLDLTIAHIDGYRGEMSFRGGTVQIQQYEPMWANLFCTFRIDGGTVTLDRIDLDSDGATTRGTGVVDMAHWPEQTYRFGSHVDFRRAREVFWNAYRFTLSGSGDLDGHLHLFKGGRDLRGTFTSGLFGVNDWRFQNVKGALHWVPERFDVIEATSGFYGGRARVAYSLAPLNRRDTVAVATFDTAYADVDLETFTDFVGWSGLRLAGRATGRNVMTWPLGSFVTRTGSGTLAAAPPPGVDLMGRALTTARRERAEARGPEMGPFNDTPLVEPLAVGGEIAYTFDESGVTALPSHVATAETSLVFEGFTSWAGRDSRLPFRVVSADWQESDRVLAAVIKAATGSARAIPVGGRGTFDGVLLGAVAAPRVEGHARGEQMRAWDVTWGDGEAAVVVENSYATVSRGWLAKDDARMDIEGLFSLGYPRRDGGEEVDARVSARNWPLVDLRHAFLLDIYPVTGLISGQYHLYDRYEAPQGFAQMTIAKGVAYDETYDEGSATLRFDGDGVYLDGLSIRKGPGTISGAAYVAWAGTYAFNVDARDIPMSDVYLFTYPSAPVTGRLAFSASGEGLFENPRYEVRGRADDITVSGAPLGDAIGRMTVRDETVYIESVEVASPTLAISAVGRVAMTEQSDADVLLRVSDTALDPFIRAFVPSWPARTSTRVGGTVRLIGELSNAPELRVLVAADRVELNAYDYAVRNDGPIVAALERETLRLDRMRLVGDGTQIDVAGDVRTTDGRISMRALGDANLSILQAFMPGVSASGQAELQADVRGTLERPVIRGVATLSDGRLRQRAVPHAVEALTGRLEFDAGGLRFDGVTGVFGGGPVQVGGRIAFEGFAPVEYGVTVTATDMHLRYPAGLRSQLDVDLALRGPVAAPLLTGTVSVRSAVYAATLDTGGTGLFGVAASGAALPSPGPPVEAGPLANLRYDVRIAAPGTLRIENRASRVVTSADLSLRGTYAAPRLFGRVDVTRGEVYLEGNRYSLTRGTIDFSNAERIEPFFDIEAETQARVPGQIYRVTFHAAGTPDRFALDFNSDPPLSQIDILSLLFGDVKDPLNAEIDSLRRPDRLEQDLIAARAARLLASPVSSEVGRVVEETLNVDTVQITPSIGDVSTQQFARLNPSARLTLGKRISDRLFLTYSRALSVSTRDQIVLLEYIQSDRFAWIVSQNEDRTYAIDLRVRHTF